MLDKIELNKIFRWKTFITILTGRISGMMPLKNWTNLCNCSSTILKLKLNWVHILIASTPMLQSGSSQRRAESAVRYMVQNGIAPDRLVAKGYGESKPIARNTNPDGSDNSDGRQKNRRTEFKILEVASFQNRFKAMNQSKKKTNILKRGITGKYST